MCVKRSSARYGTTFGFLAFHARAVFAHRTPVTRVTHTAARFNFSPLRSSRTPEGAIYRWPL
eukprot:11168171-Lingulodinium_polyedra.AAC.1